MNRTAAINRAAASDASKQEIEVSTELQTHTCSSELSCSMRHACKPLLRLCWRCSPSPPISTHTLVTASSPNPSPYPLVDEYACSPVSTSKVGPEPSYTFQHGTLQHGTATFLLQPEPSKRYRQVSDQERDCQSKGQCNAVKGKVKGKQYLR